MSLLSLVGLSLCEWHRAWSCEQLPFGRGEYTDLTVRLPDSGEEGLEVSRELASLLASYSVAVSENISLWEDVLVL